MLPREPVLVRVDAELMRQALLNLLLNAMQAMPRGRSDAGRVRRETHLRWWRLRITGGYTSGAITAYLRTVLHDKTEGQRNRAGDDVSDSAAARRSDGGAVECRPAAAERGTTFTFRLPIAAGVAARAGR